MDSQDAMEDFDHGLENVLRSLRNRAVEISTCGHVSPIERKRISESRGTFTDYAIVTSLVKHECIALKPVVLTSNGITGKRCIEPFEDEAGDSSKRARES